MGLGPCGSLIAASDGVGVGVGTAANAMYTHCGTVNEIDVEQELADDQNDENNAKPSHHHSQFFSSLTNSFKRRIRGSAKSRKTSKSMKIQREQPRDELAPTTLARSAGPQSRSIFSFRKQSINSFCHSKDEVWLFFVLPNLIKKFFF